jgi:hypothetical protein
MMTPLKSKMIALSLLIALFLVAWTAMERKSDKSRVGRRADLARFLEGGRAQGSLLAQGSALAPGEPTGDLDDVRTQIEEAERRLARDTRLWTREWAAIAVRGARTALRDQRDRPEASELLARAEQLYARVRALDRVEIAPIHEQIKRKEYGPEDFRRDLGARPPYERDPFTERVLAIEESPAEERERERDMVHYLASPVEVVFEVIAQLAPDDVLYDLGSGLGKVPLLVGWLAGVRAKGVELEPAYHRLAAERVEQMGLDRVQMINADAREVDYADGTVFFLFDPFRGEILDAVMKKIRAVAETRPVKVMTNGRATEAIAQIAWLERASSHPSGLTTFKSVMRP